MSSSIRLVLFASVVTSAVGMAGPAEAAPHGVRLTYTADPATAVAISWTSNAAGENTVIYGTTGGDLTETATAQQSFVQAAPLGNSFTATLTGLSPNTTYFYRVGSAGSYQPPAGQPTYQFTTLSDDPCDPFTFVLIGDNRADTDGVGAAPVWSDILDETLVHAPAFYVNTGDMVKNGDDPTEWAGFMDASEKGLALVPSLLTLGNHDDMDDNGPGALYSQLFELPTNPQNGWENYYSIDVGPVHFVSLDSNARGTELTQMASWLGADLAATTQPWKMVFFHHAIYSRGNHYTGEEDSGLLNKTLIPIFDANDVDFVFNGHSHNYERYAPTIGVDPDWDGSATPRSFPAGIGSAFPPGSMLPNGATATTYLVAGGAGALTTEVAGVECIDAGCTLCLGLFPIGDCDGDVWARDKQGTAVYEGKHNYVVFTVAGGRIDAAMHTTAAGNTGSGGIGDTFSMTSPEITQQCATAGMPDAGPGPGAIDAAVPGTDAGGGPGADGTDTGGCGCASPGGNSPGGLLLLALVIAITTRGRSILVVFRTPTRQQE